MLSLDSLSFSFGGDRVLDHVSLEVEDGKFVSILGPSGCGKTTLLNCIAGFYKPTSGTISLDGVDLTRWPPESRNFGVVFQEYALFPHVTMFENIAFGLRVKKMRDADIKRRVGEMARLVGLEGLLDRYPHQLSGGQRQRVALARALAPDPKLLLLDEPLTALDRGLRIQLQDELRRLHQILRLTIIMVTHDAEEAMSLSQRVVLLSGGKMIQSGTPVEIYDGPVSPLAMNYLGRSSTIAGRVASNGNAALTIAMNGTEEQLRVPKARARGLAQVGCDVAVMARPDRLLLVPADRLGDAGDEAWAGTLRGQIADVVHKGAWVDVWVRLSDENLLLVSVNSHSDVLHGVAPDQPVAVVVPTAAVHCYGSDDGSPVEEHDGSAVPG